MAVDGGKGGPCDQCGGDSGGGYSGMVIPTILVDLAMGCGSDCRMWRWRTVATGGNTNHEKSDVDH